MANVRFAVGAMHGMNIQPMVQGLHPFGKAPNNDKFVFQHKTTTAGVEKYLKKTKKYGAGAKAIIHHVKTTRPLNCWIAYRSFYSKLFDDLQQKDISGILHVLWERDPFRGKWTILAKAFSVIRDDKGKKDASLEAFLVISAPFVEIVPTNRYLATLGFEIILGDDGAAKLRQDPAFNIANIPSSMIQTSLSVDDVVQYCYRHGFFGGSVASAGLSGAQGSMIMAATAQQSAGPAGTTQGDDSFSAANEHVQPIDTTHDLGISNGQGTSQSQVPSPILGGYNAPAETIIAQPMFGTDDTAFSIDMDMIKQSLGEYPFDTAFKPNPTENLYFNPFDRYEFDAIDMEDLENFNVNDWVHEDLFQ